MESTTLKLITTANAAELLAVSETVAKKVLLRYGLHPVDYGPGRGRGLRWPYLGVLRVIEQMQTEVVCPGLLDFELGRGLRIFASGSHSRVGDY